MLTLRVRALSIDALPDTKNLPRIYYCTAWDAAAWSYSIFANPEPADQPAPDPPKKRQLSTTPSIRVSLPLLSRVRHHTPIAAYHTENGLGRLHSVDDPETRNLHVPLVVSRCSRFVKPSSHGALSSTFEFSATATASSTASGFEDPRSNYQY
jgi:hypothetical protein